MIGSPVYRPTLQDAYDEASSAPQITGALNVSGSVEWDAFKYLDASTGGTNNIFQGDGAGNSGTQTGNDNIVIGKNSLSANTSGSQNLAIGRLACQFNTTGQNNVAVGYRALRDNVTGNNNMAIGTDALINTETSNNVGVGVSAFFSNVTGTLNVGLGTNVGRSISQPTYVTAMGYEALRNGSGVLERTVAVGAQCGYGSTGDRNTYIGFRSGYSSSSGSDNVFIGYEAGYNETGSDKLYVANTNTTTPLIHGDFSAAELKTNGSFEFTKSYRTSAVETITASSDTLDDTNFIVLCDCTSNAITVNLPAASGNTGLTYVIKKIDSTANTVTIDGSGSETIDDSTTFDLTSQHEVVRIMCDGTEWWII